MHITLKFINCEIVTAGEEREPVVKGRVLTGISSTERNFSFTLLVENDTEQQTQLYPSHFCIL